MILFLVKGDNRCYLSINNPSKYPNNRKYLIRINSEAFKIQYFGEYNTLLRFKELYMDWDRFKLFL